MWNKEEIREIEGERERAEKVIWSKRSNSQIRDIFVYSRSGRCCFSLHLRLFLLVPLWNIHVSHIKNGCMRLRIYTEFYVHEFAVWFVLYFYSFVRSNFELLFLSTQFHLVRRRWLLMKSCCHIFENNRHYSIHSNVKRY